MLPAIWNTFDNVVDCVMGIFGFIVVTSFILMIALLIVPIICGIFNKEYKFEFPKVMNVCIVKTKNNKEKIIFTDYISEEKAKQHNWKIIESKIPLALAISIVNADKGETDES